MTVTISAKGQVALPKKVRNKLRITTGDQFQVEISGTKIVLTPVVTVPKDQAWFWTDEIQAKVRASEEDYEKGNYKEYTDVEELVRDLKE
ncbi:MAG: AbrB family transcriptional regulator [Syntrophus sp. (in: bacteria)]|nr:AbrB family transcriptional regulator [Syntrophus sp. (in: bacteria)]